MLNAQAVASGHWSSRTGRADSSRGPRSLQVRWVAPEDRRGSPGSAREPTNLRQDHRCVRARPAAHSLSLGRWRSLADQRRSLCL